MVSSAELIVSIIGDMTNLKKVFGEVQTQIKGMSQEIGKMGKDLSSAGSAMTTGITAPIVAIGASIGLVTSESTKFDTELRRTATMLPGITKQGFDEIGKQSIALSKQFGSDTQDINNAMYNALSSNVPEDNIFSFMQTSEKLAIGGMTDVFTSVDGLTSSVNAYGQANLSAAHAADVMFTGSKYGKATIEELAKQLADVTPIAAANKVSFEDLNSVIATMTIQGTRTPVAMTQTKAILNELSQDTTQAGAAFKQLAGESFTEFIAKGGTVGQALALLNSHVGETIPDIDALNKAVKGFEDPASEMSQKFNDLTGKSFQQFIKGGGTVQQALKIMRIESGTTTKSVADFFSNIEGKSGALQLVGEGGKLYTQTMEAMKTATGATDEAYNMMAEGMGTQTNIMKADWKAFVIEAGNSFMPVFRDTIVPFVKETLIPALEKMIPVIVSIMEAFGKLSPTLQLLIIGAVGLVAAIGPLLVIIGAVASGIGAVAGLFAAGGALATGSIIIDSLMIAISLLSSPITILIGVVALLALAWSKDWGGIQEKAAAVWTFIMNTADKLYQRLEYTYNAIIMAESKLRDRIIDTWNTISSIFSTCIKAIMDLVSGWYSHSNTNFNLVISILQILLTGWRLNWNEIQTVINLAEAAISRILDTLYSTAQNLFNRILAALSSLYSDWRNNWERIQAIINDAKNTIAQRLQEILTDAETKARDIANGIINPLSEIRTRIENLFSDIKQAGGNLVQNLIDGIEEKIDDLKNAVGEVTSAAAEYLPMNSPSKVGALSTLPHWEDFFEVPINMNLLRTKGALETGLNDIRGTIDRITNNSYGGSTVYEGSQISIGPNNLSSGLDIQALIDEINRRATAQRRARGYIL